MAPPRMFRRSCETLRSRLKIKGTMAKAWFAPLVAPELDRESAAEWLAREQPEAVIADYGMERLLASIVKPAGAGKGSRISRMRIVTRNWPSPFAAAGIDQREAEIGAATVDILAGMIERGEKGIPPNPRITMMDGQWQEGRM